MRLRPPVELGAFKQKQAGEEDVRQAYCPVPSQRPLKAIINGIVWTFNTSSLRGRRSHPVVNVRFMQQNCTFVKS